jgi:hypothetical protein
MLPASATTFHTSSAARLMRVCARTVAIWLSSSSIPR